MANTSIRKVKQYMSILLVGVLMTMSIVPPVGAEPATPELYTSVETFGDGNGSDTIIPNAILNSTSGYYEMRNETDTATIKLKLDSGKGSVLGDSYKIQGSAAGDGFMAYGTNGGGAEMIYEFDELVAGEVTISFLAYGGSGANIVKRWSLLDDQGNEVLCGGNANNADLGTNSNLECAKCIAGTCAGHKTSSDGTVTKDYMYGNGHQRSNGWYKMHLNFNVATPVASFERANGPAWVIKNNQWETYYGWEADPAKSAPYFMALGSNRGVKAIKFNFNGSTTVKYVVDDIRVSQTKLPIDAATIEKWNTIIPAAKGDSSAALVSALNTGIDAVDAELATAYNNYNADQKTYVADYAIANKSLLTAIELEEVIEQLAGILAVPMGHIATVVDLQNKSAAEWLTFLGGSEADAILTAASLMAYDDLSTGGKELVVAALIPLAPNFKVPADVSTALATASAEESQNEAAREAKQDAIIAAAKTVSDDELITAISDNLDAVSPALASTFVAYDQDQKDYVADYVEANRPQQTEREAAVTELTGILNIPMGYIATVLDLQNKTEAEWLTFLAGNEVSAMLTAESVTAFSVLTPQEQIEAIAAVMVVAADFKVPTAVSVALAAAATDAAQLKPNVSYARPIPVFKLENGAKNVHPDQPLHITFTPGININDLTDFALATQAGTQVTVTAYASYDGTQVAVVPNSSLSANTTYVLTVPDGMIGSAASSSVKAVGGTLTFSTGANDGTYQEENFNGYDYVTSNEWTVVSGLQTSFESGSLASVSGNTINTEDSYNTSVENGAFANGSGITVLQDGSVNIVEAAPAGQNKKGTLVVDFADVSTGRVQIGFDFIFNGVHTSTSDNDAVIKINSAAGTGDSASYFRMSLTKDKIMNFFAAGAESFGNTSITWTREDGTEASDGEVTLRAGIYNILFDIDLTTGIADVNVVRTTSDGTKLYGYRQTAPRIVNGSYPALSQIVFTNSVGDNYRSAEEGGMNKYAYGLDNIFVRSFTANPAPAVSYNGATTDVALTYTPVLDFATPVTETAATNAITITDKRGNNVAFTGSMDASGLAYTITPANGFEYNNSNYIITFAGCKDWSGKEVAAETFTIKTIPDAGYDSRRATIMNAAVNESGAILRSAIDTAIGDVNDEASMSYEKYSPDQKDYVAGYVEANRPTDGDFAGLGTTIGVVVDALDAVEALSTADRSGMSALIATPEKRTEMLLSAEASNAYNVLTQTQKDNTIIALAPLVHGIITPEQASVALLSAIATVTAPQPVITPSTNHTGIVTGGDGNWGSASVQVTDKVLAENTSNSVEQGDSAFNDLSSVPWASNAINILASHGIINGRGEGAFSPNDSVTREEFLKMALKAFEVQTIQEGTLPFKDVAVEDWYYTVISQAYEAKIVGGISSDTFGVGAPITRQDMALMLNRILKYQFIELKESVEIAPFTDSDSFSTNEAKEAIDILAKGGIINGREDGSFDPVGTATRAEAAAVIYRVLYRVGLL